MQTHSSALVWNTSFWRHGEIVTVPDATCACTAAERAGEATEALRVKLVFTSPDSVLPLKLALPRVYSTDVGPATAEGLDEAAARCTR